MTTATQDTLNETTDRLAELLGEEDLQGMAGLAAGLLARLAYLEGRAAAMEELAGYYRERVKELEARG